jgi:glycosyltransferase involved in cell wall biosynthesis
MIPTYNDGDYLAVAIESVLSQDPGRTEMQIEVVDDCSEIDVEALVREVGGGRVDYFRQATNIGAARNFSACVNRGRGKLVHLLHGDDAVRPGFYEVMGKPFDEVPGLGAVSCGYIAINPAGRWDLIAPRVEEHPGILDNWLDRIVLQNPFSVAGTVVRRSVYEQLRGFDERISNGEDWEMWSRIAAHFPVWYEPEPLALYRRHDGSLSRNGVLTGNNVVNAARVIDINQEILPATSREQTTRRARELAAISAMRVGAKAMKQGDVAACRTQYREALRLSQSPTVLVHGTYFALRGLQFWLQYRSNGASAT